MRECSAPPPKRTRGDPLGAMRQAYVELLGDRELLLAQMQTYAACGDDDICRRSGRKAWARRALHGMG